jgi:hypothetical protein
MKLTLALCFLLGVDYWACAVRTTGPIDQTGVRVVVQFSNSSGSPTEPVTVDAEAINDGRASVYHDVPCAGTVIALDVRGPDGKPVLLRDPRVLPACPDYCCQELASHASVKSELAFDGTLYASNGQTYKAPPGDYTVMARFDASTQPNGGSTVSGTRQAVFRWAAR